MDSQLFQTLLISIGLVFLIHCIIKNLLKEPLFDFKFINNDSSTESFSMDNTDLNPDMKKELMEYVNQNIDDMVSDYPIKEVNYYTREHPADVQSEHTDLSRFFENNDYYKQSKMLKNDPYQEFKQPSFEYGVDSLNNAPLYLKEGNNNMYTHTNDLWKYQDENVMNGASFMGDVSPNDNDMSYNAAYQSLQNI